MNCPNCGRKNTVTHQDLIVALLVECGVKTSQSFDMCQCPQNIKPPKFISGNWLTEQRALQKGDRWIEIWKKHNEPAMRDCRDLNYKYAIGSLGDIVVEVNGDYYNINNEFDNIKKLA